MIRTMNLTTAVVRSLTHRSRKRGKGIGIDQGGVSFKGLNRRTITTTPSTTCSSTTTSTGSIVSHRGGVVIPNVLLFSSSSSSSSSSIHLPPPETPVGLQLYKKVLYCSNTHILRTSLHIGTDDNNHPVNGIVGIAASTDATANAANGDSRAREGRIAAPNEAKNHARNSGLRLLSTIHHYLDGDLSRIEQVLHLTGIVDNHPTYTNFGPIIDGWYVHSIPVPLALTFPFLVFIVVFLIRFML